MEHEHLQKISRKEVSFVAVLAVVVSVLMFVVSSMVEPWIALLVSLALLVVALNLTVYICKKSGVVLLLFVFVSVLTFVLEDVGVVGWKKVVTFLLAALIFELVFLYLKAHLHAVPLDMIIGSTLSAGSIPLISAFLLSVHLASSFPLELLNLILVAFAVGLASAVITFLLWLHIQRTKPILKLESFLNDLEKS